MSYIKTILLYQKTLIYAIEDIILLQNFKIFRILTLIVSSFTMKTKIENFALNLALFQSIIATAGSLYFSEIAGYTPCVLCWYQRICMYPLVILFFISLIREDRKVYYYALPLSVIGTGVAVYHNLLYYGFIQNEGLCKAGVSCTEKFIEWFGFVTIPFLSLLAFLVIILCMLVYMKKNKKKASS